MFHAVNSSTEITFDLSYVDADNYVWQFPLGIRDLTDLVDLAILGHLHSHQTPARKRRIWLCTDGERRKPASTCV